MMPGTGGPAVARRRLAAEMRQRREAAGLTMEQAAALLEWSSAKISRIENAQVSVLPRDARLLAGIYGVSDSDSREQLIGLARQTRQKAWWHDYGLTLPAGLQVYAALEAEAETLRSYHAELIPPLLQTSAYRHAVISPGDDDAVEAAALLTARQHRRATTGNPRLHAIISEAVLRRPVGGPAVMAAQLTHLAAASQQPHITVQVLPFTAGTHPAMDTPFTLFTFPGPADPDIAWPGPQADSCLDNPADVQLYQHMFTRLHDLALPPHDSRVLITRAVGHLARQDGQPAQLVSLARP